MTRMRQALRVLTGVVIAGALAAPAMAQVGIYIGRTPPPLRYEVPPPAPGPGYAWNEGYWNWGGGRYNWVGGRWAQPPYAGAYWNHPHYDHYDRGWQMHPGYWGHDAPGYRHDWGRR